MRAKAIS